MKYERFEDLPVWKSGMDLAERLYDMVDDSSFAGQGDVRNQMQRASLSICNNIAEGFERGTTQELITFLYYARGSAGEVRSMLWFVERRSRFDHLRSQISDLKSLAEGVARQLRAGADSLQNSEIKGQRYLTMAERKQYEQRQSRNQFFERLDEIIEGARSEQFVDAT